MPIVSGELIVLALSFFLVAFLYASVGFGGGSSYLALLALTLSSFYVIRSTALACNLVVVLGSCWVFHKKGYLNLKKFFPFVLTSIPMAFFGALFRLEERVFFVLLGVVLLLVAVSLTFQTLKIRSKVSSRHYPKWFPMAISAVVGLLSGLVGIGGGIFLAPILNYLRWERPIIIAALASFFILVNSVSGIIGLMVNHTLEWQWPQFALLLIAVVLGGQLGVRLSVLKVSPNRIRYFTAILVFWVGIRVLLINGLQLKLAI